MKRFLFIFTVMLSLFSMTAKAANVVTQGVTYPITVFGNDCDEYFQTSEVVPVGSTLVVFTNCNTKVSLPNTSRVGFGANGMTSPSTKARETDTDGNAVVRYTRIGNGSQMYINIYQFDEEYSNATWCYVICDASVAATIANPSQKLDNSNQPKPGQDEDNAVVINATAKSFSSVEIDSKNVFYAKFTPAYNGSAIINMTQDATAAQYKAQGTADWNTIPADGKISISKDATYLLKWEFAEATEGNVSYELEIPGFDKSSAIVLTEGVAENYETFAKAGKFKTEVYFKLPVYQKEALVKLTYTYSSASDPTVTVRKMNGDQSTTMDSDNTYKLSAGVEYYIMFEGSSNGVTGTMKYDLVSGGQVEKTFGENMQNDIPDVNTNVDKLTISRPLYAEKWNTLCLPIDVEAGYAFPEVLEIANIEKVTNTYYRVDFRKLDETETMEAGKPYIVKPEENLSTCSFNNVTIKAKTPKVVTFDCGAEVQGIFGKKDNIEGVYYISNNEFVYADIPVSIKAFRIYFTLPEGAQARSISIDDSIISTAIEEMNATGAEKASVMFDLSGKVVNTKKGIVIENGKKVMY